MSESWENYEWCWILENVEIYNSLFLSYSTRKKFHASQRSKKFYTNLYILFHPVGFLKRNTCVKFQVYSPYKSLALGLKAVRSLSVNHFCFELMYFQFPVKHAKSVKYIFITHSLLLVPWKNTSLYLFSVQPLDTPFVFLRDKRNRHCADTLDTLHWSVPENTVLNHHINSYIYTTNMKRERKR